MPCPRATAAESAPKRAQTQRISPTRRFGGFATAILHGDKAHRDWLIKAEAFIAGKALPKAAQAEEGEADPGAPDRTRLCPLPSGSSPDPGQPRPVQTPHPLTWKRGRPVLPFTLSRYKIAAREPWRSWANVNDCRVARVPRIGKIHERFAQHLILEGFLAEQPLQFAHLVLQSPVFGGGHHFLAGPDSRQRALGI
jgi:hypothetical protein